MRHGSLFSGIGGFDLAAKWMGWKNVFQVEIDPFCQKVLKKNFPEAKIYSDIKQFDGSEYKGKIDIISGGFPCQPFSIAGKRKGREDNRSLWSEMSRIITEVEPSSVLCENVPGIVSLELDTVLSDLEDKGYSTETFIVPACSINAPHRRDRVWIIAYHKETTDYAEQSSWQDTTEIGQSILRQFVANSQKKRQQGENAKRKLCGKGRITQYDWNSDWIEVATGFCGVDARILNRVDRIGALGNAIVPELAYIFFYAIETLTLNTIKLCS